MIVLADSELKRLKATAIFAEKGKTHFSVRIAVTGGRVRSEHLRVIADLAERYGEGGVHLTTRQSAEIQSVPYEMLEKLQAELRAGGVSLAAAGKCVRGIVACPGDKCLFGQIDTQKVALLIHERVGKRASLPHKFKIAVTGCKHGCAKPIENDLGVMGSAKGFVVFVGGKVGKQPRWADQLPNVILTEEELLDTVGKIIDWYAANGEDRERFGATIDRVGLDRLIASL